MTIRFEKGPIAEGTSGELTTTSDGSTVTFLDKDGSPIPAVNMDSIVMTLIETASGAIVNSRQNQNVLNANNCTYQATSGLFTWDIQPADTTIVNGETDVDGIEEHLATVTAKWDTTEELSFEVLLKIKNLRSVPQVSATGGAFEINYTVEDSDGTGLEGVHVSVTSSSAGPSSSVVAHGITDEDGLVTFSLDTGTYYLWRSKSGYDFDDPKTLTVTAGGDASIS